MTTLEKTITAAANRDMTMREQIKSWLPKRWYAHFILLISILIIGFPMFYAVIVATQNNTDVFSYRFTPGNYFLENWDVVMNQRQLGGYILNSVFVSVSIALAKVIFSLTAGLAFVYFRFPGKWLVFGFVLITLMLPTDVLVISLFRMVSELHWGDSYTALIVPFMASATGTFLFRQHFMSIPSELSEAAQLDGATPLQFLFRVLVPLSWNTIGALTVIQFISAWNQFVWPLIVIRSQEHQVVQVGISTLISIEIGDNFGPMMLGAVLASLPPLLVFVVLQKQFLSGFALTREK
jgi:sn-glycerol 3-phosphate transport system permease protein